MSNDAFRPSIPIAGPSITDLEIAYVADAARTNWYGNANDYISRFEQGVADRSGRRFGVALPSCTSGLHLALAALGVGPGDEVIVPDCTWIASAAPIAYVGATPVFADIDAETWCVSAETLEAAITLRTKAIIIVDLYGHMPDWDAVTALAAARGVAIIEDAAEAVGSTYRGRPAGGFGTVSVFSFHGSKTLTTGEGGMLVCDDEALFDRVQVLRDHGRKRGDTLFFNEEVAFKYKMSSVQAAMGLAQLERLDELVTMKRRIFGWYRERLSGSNGLSVNPDFEPVFNSYWMSTVRLAPSLGLGKAELIPRLRAEGVDVRPFFHPLSTTPAYRETEQAAQARARNHVGAEISATSVNLPSALNLTEADVDRVCSALFSILADFPGTT